MAGRKKISRRQRRKRKLIVFIIEIIILILLALALFAYNKLNLIQSDTLDKTKVKTNEVSEETQATFQGYTTIALFGLDNREQGVYTTGNSDLIMVMNINNDTKEMGMVSVYRDTYLNVAAADEDENFRKANAAYAYGGPEQAVTMLNRNLDIEIDNYVSFDFSAVADAIDILGGVDIEITSEAELGYLNDYIMANNDILGTDSPTLNTTGTHTLDGVQAVAYARIRYTKGGDYKRAERQRRVLNEMIGKAKKANLVQLNELVDAIFPKIRTDLSKKDIISMATAMLGYDMSNSGGFPYDRKTKPLGKKGDVVVPCDLESNVIELHRQLFGTEAYEPSATIKEYNDIIIDDTGYTSESAERDDFNDADDFTGTSRTTGEDEE